MGIFLSLSTIDSVLPEAERPKSNYRRHSCDCRRPPSRPSSSWVLIELSFQIVRKSSTHWETGATLGGTTTSGGMWLLLPVRTRRTLRVRQRIDYESRKMHIDAVISNCSSRDERLDKYFGGTQREPEESSYLVSSARHGSRDCSYHVRGLQG